MNDKQCPNCAEDNLIPALVVRADDEETILLEADFCPACQVLQESHE